MNNSAAIRIIASEKNCMEGEAVHKDAIWTSEHIDEVHKQDVDVQDLGEGDGLRDFREK